MQKPENVLYEKVLLSLFSHSPAKLLQWPVVRTVSLIKFSFYKDLFSNPMARAGREFWWEKMALLENHPSIRFKGRGLFVVFSSGRSTSEGGCQRHWVWPGFREDDHFEEQWLDDTESFSPRVILLIKWPWTGRKGLRIPPQRGRKQLNFYPWLLASTASSLH